MRESTDAYYTSRKPLLMLGFDWAARKTRNVGGRRYGRKFTDAIAAEARQEYESLIPQLPYIGGRRNPHTQLIIAAAMFLALYKPLKAHGKPVEEIGALVYEAVEAFYSSLPRFSLRLYGRLYFTRYTLRRARKRALESQKRQYSDDWVFTVIEGDGEEFDWGVDYVECGICKFFHAQGADEFVPYMCQLDFLASDWFGWGLVRTTTIAQGAERCDFRFKRGPGTRQPNHC
jgi:hypothetical protein